MRDGSLVTGKFHSTDRKRKEMRLDVDGQLRSLPLQHIRFASIRR